MDTSTVVFSMKTDSKTFISMRKLKDEGNEEMLAQVVMVTAMMNEVEEKDVLAAYAVAIKAAEAQDALDGFKSGEVNGYTVPDSLSSLVSNGRQLAERFGGTVQFTLDVDDEGNVSINPRFRGIDGISSGGGGGGTGVRYVYSFDGKEIKGKLEDFVLKTFPGSETAAIFKQYAKARAEGKTSRIGAISALNRGEANGDRLGISWEEKNSE